MITGPFYTSNTFHQRKCFAFVIICNYLGESHVAAATWPCTYCITEYGVFFTTAVQRRYRCV